MCKRKVNKKWFEAVGSAAVGGGHQPLGSAFIYRLVSPRTEIAGVMLYLIRRDSQDSQSATCSS